ncbi:hypothetical protein ABL78_5928 [Leptomonas seymouri]|uniref:Uncharacterized protein n=1 Tax=Leptomonas seymouri TaxID=5684 RepID=A0A0N0P490_LEPSE|nr:hypothetical protein ABL78_5928 [Leptomonas seymouri]|eukprot:KPI85019.1 hypothetical protein ABL78_5928 [Leptomonas seymouri]
MRDFVTLFVEASLAKGEWLAALSSLQLSASSHSIAASPCLEAQSTVSSHYHHIASTLVKNGEWVAALATLRSVPSPWQSPSQGCAYSSAYLAARVQVYHDVLLSYYKNNTSELERSAPYAPSSCPQPSSHNAAAWEKVLTDAFALVKEAFHVFPLTSEERFEVGVSSGSATPSAAGTSSSSSSLSPPMSREPESTANAAAMLTWYESQLRAAPVTPSLSLELKEAMMAQLQAASQVALRGATFVSHTTVPSAPSAPSSSDAPTTASQASDALKGTNKSNEGSNDFHQENEPAMAQPSPANTAIEAELSALLNRTHPARDDWSVALELLHRLPAERLTPHMFTAVIRLLARRGRRSAMESLVRTYVFPVDPELSKDEAASHEAAAPAQATAAVLVADAVVLKSIAEACRRLRCPQLAKKLLHSRRIRAHLTPSAAVPVVMVLRDAEEYTVVMEWWEDLRNGERTTQYPLLRHAKLSSYVASCVLRSTRSSDNNNARHLSGPNAGWVEALRIFEDADRGAAQLALILLFKLRLLRQVRQWEAALQLFCEFRDRHSAPESILLYHSSRSSGRSSRYAGRATKNAEEPSSVIESIFAVLTEERAEQWVPPAVLRQLRQQVAQYRLQGK